MTEPLLTVSRHTHPAGPVVVTVSGELDHHTAPRATEVLDGLGFAPGAHLVIDLTGLTYCDSTGITVLVGAYHRTRSAEASLSLAGLGPDLLRVIETVGLDQVFPLYPTTEDAVAALRH
ncbi:anti-sigma factor antagonist [Streptomyces fumigatiscleroticus]|nr:anti-sigma factor antagonist [Streptomyces fumigatiscleroticus]